MSSYIRKNEVEIFIFIQFIDTYIETLINNQNGNKRLHTKNQHLNQGSAGDSERLENGVGHPPNAENIARKLIYNDQIFCDKQIWR